MVSCSGERVEVVEGRKSFWWSREDTFLLISQYREHEKLFKNVYCQKKNVWELITTSIWRQKIQTSAHDQSRLRESGNHRHSLFASVVNTTVFREMTEKSAHFTGKLKRSMVTGLMFARMRQATALGRQITFPSDRVKRRKDRGNGRGRQE